jgi:hypothetical protein
MWIGRRPAAMAPVEHAAGTESFAEAVTGACAACGCDVDDYLAAAGAYGSWLVRFSRDGRRQRLVWNGKDGRLVLEQATTGPEWQELGSSAVAGRDEPHFVAAIRDLLGGGAHAAQA